MRTTAVQYVDRKQGEMTRNKGRRDRDSNSQQAMDRITSLGARSTNMWRIGIKVMFAVRFGIEVGFRL